MRYLAILSLLFCTSCHMGIPKSSTTIANVSSLTPPSTVAPPLVTPALPDSGSESGASSSRRASVRVGGSDISIVFDSDSYSLTKDELTAWIGTGAKAVSSYFGRFPVKDLTVRVRASRGSGVHHGQAAGYYGRPSIKVAVGYYSDQEDLRSDWVITHEMVHLGFPCVAERHHWIEEGTATYIEPIARERIGVIKPEEVWRDLVVNLPNGLPKRGDRGLDYTPTWGRTYWGGALFCLLADVEIRKQTHNRQGLEHAIRAITEANGVITEFWDIREVLRTGDKATKGTALETLYDKMRDKPYPVDLDALWKQLGVELRGETVIFHNDAPLAHVRKAICG